MVLLLIYATVSLEHHQIKKIQYRDKYKGLEHKSC